MADHEVVVVERLDVDPGIELTAEQTKAFIELWEKYPCLWNLADPKYRDRRERLYAMQQIANVMGLGWDTDQVDRKCKSLKGQYNNEKRKQTTLATGVVKKRQKWTHFDRLKAFPGLFDQDDISVTPLPTGTPLPATPARTFVPTFAPTPAPKPSPTRAAAPTLPTTLAPTPPPPTSAPTPAPTLAPTPAPSTLAPTNKPVPSESRNPSSSSVREHANNSTASHGSQHEHQVYAMYVAQRLSQLRSKKTVARLKRQIDNLINEALEAELSD